MISVKEYTSLLVFLPFLGVVNKNPAQSGIFFSGNHLNFQSSSTEAALLPESPVFNSSDPFYCYFKESIP
ncbi:hypothetical protein BMR05_06910 [Methylococcaceae bacterium HT4]|nr:hypothetical protein BMR07_13995 [Methylococcaceae bacterium CS1]TXL06404.1 hypothetical protein BMR09_08045 [Methylococcaceae bacterium CS3]TXL11582.1 hypothetical protein BMR08_03325 [Methylococcaceae bacterium CS2]TXL14572.1 hypothetical protein BMR05_06910 [Methylococcaceae bacterium HT4]TXL19964.1 hypothetical protein BMR06_07410 [Methylococcaceae bacterium HT5]